MHQIKARDYEWHQIDGRGHHLVIFTLPEELREKPTTSFGFTCSLPTWTPTHGSISNWDAVRVDDERIGLLIPRMWWNIFFGMLSKKCKVNQFSIKRQ